MSASKVAGQTVLSGSLTDVYVCPTNRTVECTVFICNLDDVATLISLSIAVGGEAHNEKQYIWHDSEIGPNVTRDLRNLWLNEGDVIRALAENDHCAMTVLVNDNLELAK